MESKLPLIGTTIFTKMSLMAAENKAINLAQGFPNYPIDAQLQNLIGEHSTYDVHQYAPMQGNVTLRQEIAQLINTKYKCKIDPNENILITAGATQGIFTTIQALVSAGEEVIILDPSYDCYEVPILLVGARPNHILLDKKFRPDWQKINDSVSSKTKMIIINSPHNPSGVLWEESDMLLLVELVKKHPKLIVLSDEVYEFITFEKPHISAAFNEILRERSVVVSSFGKTFHVTGWKVGYLTAPKALLTEIIKVHQYLVFSVNSLAQSVLGAYLPLSNIEQLGQFYKEKRDTFREALSGSRFTLLPCEGAYFQLASYSAISNKSDIDFCEELTKKHGVAAIPVSAFYSNKFDQQLVRFCFAKDNETILKATQLLCAI
ncbi:MAG: aminotransferase class I/II-fold pyridoxal phosphate-dependent enzyme [Crocinitomicaceae bacterium]|nr:aminotransferase class I/II-fold pyridoxal phosphate-dependent enzyme [Crocinitomicaceae bacterium]